MHEKVLYNGWPNCIRLFNREVELIATTDVGPRIVRFGFIGGQNFFHLLPEHAGKTGGDQWRIYGGHRFWIAPEAMPFSYNPDNDDVEFLIRPNGVTLRQKQERITGMVKEVEITLSDKKNEAVVLHRLTNKNATGVDAAPWGLSVLAQGGRAIIPQEPYGEGDDFLLPARPLVLWQFTRMNDPRWKWGDRYIQAVQNPILASEQKIGVLNKQGWTAYCLNDEVLIKKFNLDAQAIYPDYNCNNETYINGKFLEIETLGPLTRIPAGKSVEHTEYWCLAKGGTDGREDSIDANILPLVNSFKTPSGEIRN
jgi:hypothetical protein